MIAQQFVDLKQIKDQCWSDRFST